MDQSDIPNDFPRPPTGGISGSHPKILARKINGQYVADWSEQERRQRFELCEDLVEQLITYCQRKSAEHPEWTLDFIIDRTAAGLVKKIVSGQWSVAIDEKNWIIAQLRKRVT